MAYDPGAIDAALSAAVGDEPALIAELRQAFVESAARAMDVIETSRDAAAWRSATGRLRGLAASFGAVRLAAMADQAMGCAPGDAATMKQLRRLVARL